ncbi:MAG: DUF2721 domain-containing protein [Betaproteobacteria bacterium]|nr:DUF2721 domain-containing protein [Betaproteobacteria bacterium]
MALEIHISDITHVIQLAVAPVFLLTAVGTIITALTNRLGRAVDRRRVVEDRLPNLADETAEIARDELDALGRRIRSIYVATALAVLCGLFVCLSISLAFLGALVAIDLALTVAVLFVLAMFALIGALLMILREIFLAVTAPRHSAH